MALPTTINTVYSAGSQVKSADLNEIQTSIVGHETARTALQTEHVMGGEGVSNDAGVLDDAFGGKALSTTGDEVWYRAPVRVGKVLRNIRARVNVGASTTVTATLSTRDTSPPAPTGDTDNTSASGVQTLTLSAIDLTIAAGSTYQLNISKTGAATCGVFWVEFDWDDP